MEWIKCKEQECTKVYTQSSIYTIIIINYNEQTFKLCISNDIGLFLKPAIAEIYI